MNKTKRLYVFLLFCLVLSIVACNVAEPDTLIEGFKESAAQSIDDMAKELGHDIALDGLTIYMDEQTSIAIAPLLGDENNLSFGYFSFGSSQACSSIMPAGFYALSVEDLMTERERVLIVDIDGNLVAELPSTSMEMDAPEAIAGAAGSDDDESGRVITIETEVDIQARLITILGTHARHPGHPSQPDREWWSFVPIS